MPDGQVNMAGTGAQPPEGQAQTLAGRVEIERISLRVTGMDPIEARALARAIAAGLAPTLSLAPGEASLDHLRVEVQAKPGDDRDALARRAVARLAPLINRVGPSEAAR
jgi:hypothetical protein